MIREDLVLFYRHDKPDGRWHLEFEISHHGIMWLGRRRAELDGTLSGE